MTPSPYLDKTDPWSSHSLIGRRLRGCPQGSRVLDVGSGPGALGRACRGLDLRLDGIERNPEWAQAARPWYRALAAAPLESTPDEFIAGHQVVVCADLLEHLPDPEAALGRLVRLQPNGALFLVSVPNVANLWVRLGLLLGRFDYAERGILDRTHLRFFTRRSLLALLHGAGLHVRRVQVTPLPLNLAHPFFERSALGRLAHRGLAWISQAFPTLLGYQFIVEAVK